MVAAAADRAKIFQNQPLTTSIETLAVEKHSGTPCTKRSFMLWSGLMSAEPRSDRRVDQGEENEKGNTHKGSESMSIVVTPHAGQAPYQSQGSIAPRGRSPQRAHFHLLPASGRAGARASTDHVALTRVRRRRIASSGRPGESC